MYLMLFNISKVLLSYTRYNLRRATYALIKVYGKNMRLYEMSYSYWKEVTSNCHVHDERKNYISVSEYQSIATAAKDR